jgi:SAM-dependent methyltransferase
MTDLTAYHGSPQEQERIADLLALLPQDVESVLDVGARDGFVSRLLADRFSRITALDLEKPSISHERITCVKGDVTCLDFPDATFDLVSCTEVLEHVPSGLLGRSCLELIRVSSRYIAVGVPYRQDIRVGRTTCYTCGKKNPPWGHQNKFDESRLRSLFPGCRIAGQSFVGTVDIGTNAISTYFLDLAGNPYGTYAQDEPCIFCGVALLPPPPRNVVQRIFTRTAYLVQSVQKPFLRAHANWIHILLAKESSRRPKTDDAYRGDH